MIYTKHELALHVYGYCCQLAKLAYCSYVLMTIMNYTAKMLEMIAMLYNDTQ